MGDVCVDVCVGCGGMCVWGCVWGDVCGISVRCVCALPYKRGRMHKQNVLKTTKPESHTLASCG